VALGTAVSGPAASWAAKLPDGLPRLLQRLSFLEAPFAALQHFWQQIEDFAGWQNGTGPSAGSAFLAKLFTGTRSFASGFFTTLLFLFFLLVAGEIFLQRLVEIMPRFGSKRQVVDIANQIESDISAYLLTITTMNAAVSGSSGVGDPILWGTIAFLLNFVPILGPLVGVGCRALEQRMKPAEAEPPSSSNRPERAHLGEGEEEAMPLTPLQRSCGLPCPPTPRSFSLAGYFLFFCWRRFTFTAEIVWPLVLAFALSLVLNPVLRFLARLHVPRVLGALLPVAAVLALVAPGAILSVPILAIMKIVCDRVRPLAAFGHFLEG
jgi:predicted PurR-regulated permease PerM